LTRHAPAKPDQARAMFLQLAVVEEQVIPGQLRKEVAYSRHSTIPYTNLAKASGGPQNIFLFWRHFLMTYIFSRI